MLILSRNPGESIVINGNIVVTVLPSGSNNIKLGIEAPKNVTVDRAEIHARRVAGIPAPKKEIGNV